MVSTELRRGERPVVLYGTDDLLECVGEMERMRNIAVTCVNRTPGSNVELLGSN